MLRSSSPHLSLFFFLSENELPSYDSVEEKVSCRASFLLAFLLLLSNMSLI